MSSALTAYSNGPTPSCVTSARASDAAATMRTAATRSRVFIVYQDEAIRTSRQALACRDERHQEVPLVPTSADVEPRA